MCTNPPARPKTTQPLGALLWKPPLTSTLVSSAGPRCTLPFPGLKAFYTSWAGRNDAASAADHRTRVSLDQAC